MTARDAILGRLRTAQKNLLLPRATAVAPAAFHRATLADCLARFSVEAAALGIDLFVETSVPAVHQRFQQLVSGRRVLSWDRDQLPYEIGSLLHDATFGDAPREEQAAAEIGVTGCHAALAETASVVLFSGPGRSRAVSLLPSVHVAIVERAQLCFTMAEMFASNHRQFDASSSCTVITGPSRTADIELTLTLGIHGPGRVVVIIGP